jgi:hypothetical protein
MEGRLMSSRNIIGRRTKELWSRNIHKVLDGLGRCVTVYKMDAQTDCPNCYYDRINRESTGRYKTGGPTPFTVGRCPYCKGRGYTRVPRKKSIHALVTWRPTPRGMMSNDTLFTAAGKESDTYVRLKTDPCHLELIRDSKYALIDGLKCELHQPPTIRGLGSRKVLVALFLVSEKYKPGESV